MLSRNAQYTLSNAFGEYRIAAHLRGPSSLVNPNPRHLSPQSHNLQRIARLARFSSYITAAAFLPNRVCFCLCLPRSTRTILADGSSTPFPLRLFSLTVASPSFFALSISFHWEQIDCSPQDNGGGSFPRYIEADEYRCESLAWRGRAFRCTVMTYDL